jgi:hypothetical protein
MHLYLFILRKCLKNEAYKRLLADVEHNNEILTEELDYTMKMIEQEERRMGITLTVIIKIHE